MFKQQYFCDLCDKQIDGVTRDGVAVKFGPGREGEFTFLRYNNSEARGTHLCLSCVENIAKLREQAQQVA